MSPPRKGAGENQTQYDSPYFKKHLMEVDDRHDKEDLERRKRRDEKHHR